MTRAGVTVAIGMIDDNDARQTRLQTQYAGNLVALAKVPGSDGLNWGQALAAITSTPAEIMGLGAELGSLKPGRRADVVIRSEEHTSELQSLMRISYAVFCLKKKNKQQRTIYKHNRKLDIITEHKNIKL